MRVAEATNLVENIEGSKMRGPDKLPQIGTSERDSVQQDRTPRHRTPGGGWREAAQGQKPKYNICHRSQTKGQIKA